MNAMKWLIRREFWENKGGFFWAPVISGGLFLVLNVLAMTIVSAAAGRAHIQIGMIKLDKLLSSVDPAAMTAAASGIDLTFLMVSGMVAVVSAVVVFFYSLGALYDERRDRSILFWKSLPLSDRDTVLSKGVSALLLAPGIGILAGIATAFGMLLLLGLYFAFHGQNVFGLFFWHAHPVKMALTALAMVPMWALWALPSVGWLMLCSAWARSKPFLWAVGTPIGAGVLVSWFDLMNSVALPDTWFWKHVVGHLLLGVVPGTWMSEANFNKIDSQQHPFDAASLINLGDLYKDFANPELWIGAIAGLAMLVLATRMRRWRDEA